MITIIIISFLVGLIFAPLGCFVLWKKYVNFGDGLAHASMLAGAITIITSIPIAYSGIINSIIFALAIYKLRNNADNNAAIGLISSIMISIALILSYTYSGSINIDNLLFGDIIAANTYDIITLCILLLVVITFIIITYKGFILSIINQDMASSYGIKVNLIELIFLIILSLTILSTIKIVGALLITSIILIPAMIARIISHSPIMMMINASAISLLMNIIAIICSFYFDLPFAPLIVITGGVLYAIISLIL